MSKRAVADLSRKPSSDYGGTNILATGLWTEYMTDKSFDPPQRLRGPERIAPNAVQQAFEAVVGPVVELICKSRGIVVNEYDIVRAFVARGHEPPANDLRRLTPPRD